MIVEIEASIIRNQCYWAAVKLNRKFIQTYDPMKGKRPTAKELERKLKELGNVSNLQETLKEYQICVNLIELQYSNDGYF